MRKLAVLGLCFAFMFMVVPIWSATASRQWAAGTRQSSEVVVLDLPTIDVQWNPFIDILHLSIHPDGLIHGTDDADPYYFDQPILGFVDRRKGIFIIFIDGLKDVDGNPLYYELIILIGSTSTGSGIMYRTTDGLVVDGPDEFWLTPVASSENSATSGPALASASDVGVSDLPTIDVQWNPFIDILHLSVHPDKMIHGTDEAPGYYVDQPILGFAYGGNFYIAIDFTKDVNGDPIYYELALLVGTVATRDGDMYRTTDGLVVDGPEYFWLTPV